MARRSLRTGILGAALLLVGLVAAQPAFADTELGDSGKVGAHSLRDTHSSPGATCRFRFDAQVGLGKLRSMTVHPPRMAASPGKSVQLIGWRFTIQRRLVGERQTSWRTVYKSAEQTRTIGGQGSFYDMRAPISVPANDGVTGVHQYRAIVKMFWYATNGQTVIGSSRHRDDYYKGVMNNSRSWIQNGYCASFSPS